MKLAVVSQKRLDNIIKLADAIEEGEPFNQDKEAILEAAKGMGWALRHVVLAYETLFNNCCDSMAETLEFKPELAAFTDVMEAKANGVRLIAEERARQLKKWGGVEHDRQHVCQELVWNALTLLSSSMPGLKPIDAWGLIAKHPDRIEQLKIAGALIAAEIDRLQFKPCGVEVKP